METIEERIKRLKQEARKRMESHMEEIKKKAEEAKLEQKNQDEIDEKAELERERAEWKPGGCKSCRA